MQAYARAALLLAALCSHALPVFGQGVAHSFRELRLLVREGDTVTVVDTAGREVKGRITRLDADTLVLGTGDRRAWQESDVARIRQRRQDSLANGALIGLGIGAGLVGIAVVADPPHGDERGWAVLAAALYGGVGAGIGVGIDALIRDDLDVYRREGGGPQVRVRPMLHPRGGGVQVAVGF